MSSDFHSLVSESFHTKSGINLRGAMGKIAPDFSKWPLHLESMGPFYNVKRKAVTFLYQSFLEMALVIFEPTISLLKIWFRSAQ